MKVIFVYCSTLFVVFNILFSSCESGNKDLRLVNNKTHEIDNILNACIDNPELNTLGMIDCELQALENWKTQIQFIFQQLLSISKTNQDKEQLTKSHEKWEEFVLQEEEFLNNSYNKLDGSMWRVILISKKVELYRKRYLDLKDYLTLFENL
jgi:hypothetical protein